MNIPPQLSERIEELRFNIECLFENLEDCEALEEVLDAFEPLAGRRSGGLHEDAREIRSEIRRLIRARDNK